MSNTHYLISEDFEVTLNLNVKIKSCSNYKPKFNHKEIKDRVSDFKKEIKKHL